MLMLLPKTQMTDSILGAGAANTKASIHYSAFWQSFCRVAMVIFK